eukprot:TRINITY_DN5907_c0_g1_i2.p1 TRINITY_DN5907_c0_g1~~TRINITY_DN5907_c0_g1_i2.p1  ORF type:complete len:333 (-),score=7.23 TRINITY_DN5907_c0_g1_i2:141-1139(-)
MANLTTNLTSSGFDWSVQKVNAINDQIWVSSILGILGSLFIAVNYLLWPQSRSFGTTLMFWLSIADLMNAIFWLPFWSTSSYQTCIVQASMIQYCLVCSFLWATCISFTMYRTFASDNAQVEQYSTTYHIISWILPIPLTIFPLTSQHYERVYCIKWCWTLPQNAMHSFFLYGPLFVLFLFNATFAITTITKVKLKGLKPKLVRRILSYFFAFSICQVPAVINFVQILCSPNDPIYALYYLQVTFQPLQGLINGFVYGFYEKGFLGWLRECLQYVFQVSLTKESDVEVMDEVTSKRLLENLRIPIFPKSGDSCGGNQVHSYGSIESFYETED